MMAEKRYPVIEEKESVSMAAEPIGAVASNYDDAQLYGIDNWPGMPLVGPTNVDDANARIDEAEREMEENGGMDWTEFKSMLVNRHLESYAI